MVAFRGRKRDSNHACSVEHLLRVETKIPDVHPRLFQMRVSTLARTSHQLSAFFSLHTRNTAILRLGPIVAQEKKYKCGVTSPWPRKSPLITLLPTLTSFYAMGNFNTSSFMEPLSFWVSIAQHNTNTQHKHTTQTHNTHIKTQTQQTQHKAVRRLRSCDKRRYSQRPSVQ